MPVYRSDSGFTLIEFMISVVILMVGLLGLLQTVNLSISTNKVNQLRNEAVIVADQEISRQMAKGFDDISAATISRSLVSRPILNGFHNYSVIRTVQSPFSNSKKVDLEVHWRYKNIPYSHDVSTVISKRN